jgi:predicted nucleic acid-binding protein
MRKKLLDTNILSAQWQRKGGRRAQGFSSEDVKGWADELIAMHGGAAIVTPVYIEFICGATSQREMQLAESYLAVFQIADLGDIRVDDWSEAGRIARRIPYSGKPRQLGDCLIRAVANRLRMDVISGDLGFPRTR